MIFLLFLFWIVFENIELNFNELYEISCYLVIFWNIELFFQYNWLIFRKSKITNNLLVKCILIESQYYLVNFNGLFNFAEYFDIDLVIFVNLYSIQVKHTSPPYQTRPN